MPKLDFASLLRSKYARALSLVLLAQAVLFYSVSHGDSTELKQPLSAFPKQIDDWHVQSEGVVDKETLDVLRADDTLTRWYETPSRAGANLFVAYFKTQRTGQAPHSPKNCLPGSGWMPSVTSFVNVPIPGRNETIRINHYVVAKGEDKSVVLYWYQSQNRVIAEELKAKLYLVSDSIRHHRSDTALVRVVVPVGANQDTEKATKIGIDFVQSVYPALRQYLPS